MKIALVFDDLIQLGGAERLLSAIHEVYPDAPIYTSHASKKWEIRCAALSIRLITSFMQRLPFRIPLNRLYGLLGIHALAFETFDFREFDVVLSISSRFAHGIVVEPPCTHICYMNSPGRMFWDSRSYFETERFLGTSAGGKMCNLCLAPFLCFLRIWDYSAAQRVDHFLANSLVPQSRIKKYYRRDSKIIHPFVPNVDPAVYGTWSEGVYFLVITRLVPWKRVDVAVEACEKLSLKLKVIGTGPDLARLRKNSNGSTEFLGYVTDEEKYRQILGCKALLVTQLEDFGIAVLEAMLFGKPVVAYGSGGVLETVVPGVTGEFFYDQHAESLANVLAGFDPLRYSREDCKNQALKFSKEAFKNELDDFVKKVYHGKDCL